MNQDNISTKRIQTSGCAIHCQNCSISQLCIPFALNDNELDQLDQIIERKKPIQKGQLLFRRVMACDLCMQSAPVLLKAIP